MNNNNNDNDNEFNAMNGNNLVSVYELISTYGMEAMPQAMEILFNEAITQGSHIGLMQESPFVKRHWHHTLI
jgi:hypothetical protein